MGPFDVDAVLNARFYLFRELIARDNCVRHKGPMKMYMRCLCYLNELALCINGVFRLSWEEMKEKCGKY